MKLIHIIHIIIHISKICGKRITDSYIRYAYKPMLKLLWHVYLLLEKNNIIFYADTYVDVNVRF